MICTNQGCITRPEQEESVAPLMVKASDDALRCYYCDQLMGSLHLV
jgi:aspartate carbamoyltransferase regulatory subunit